MSEPVTPGPGPSDNAAGYGDFGYCKPSFAEFVALAAEHSIVPLWREVVADLVTPVGAFLNVVGDNPGFLLESVEGGERWGRYSFVGRSPLATIVAGNGHVSLLEGPLRFPESVREASAAGVLATLEALLAAYRSPDLPDLPPLHGGLVGYLGYDVVREVERLTNVPHDDLGYPEACLSLIGQLCAFDHWGQRVVLIDNVVVDADAHGEEAILRQAYQEGSDRLDQLARDLCQPVIHSPQAVPGSTGAVGRRDDFPAVTPNMSPSQYQAAVVAAQEHIRLGDIFQVVLSQRFEVVGGLGADPFDFYRALRLVNPSPYLYFLRTEAVTVAGSSPEPMVRLRDGIVTSRPIAGTRRRGATPEEDRLLAGQLAEHPKEIAEHIMLVDLARNDVGRVVRFGTEEVEELMTIERYSHVMHMTSQVVGELMADKGPIDVLKATLPAGTLSGAPKVRAMEIIDSFEPTKRGIYGGVVGYIDFSGNLDTAIAIRTMVIGPDGRATVQAGAGIVADSDPVDEHNECMNKAAALLAAVGPARRMSAGARKPVDVGSVGKLEAVSL